MLKTPVASWKKTAVVVISAVALTTLAVSASDELSGYRSQMLGSLGNSNEASCKDGSVLVAYGSHAICMDIFEASAGADCLYLDPKSELETNVNISSGKCEAVSLSEVLPWRFVNQAQAAQLCARVGKRLPTSNEWYKVALGTADLNTCVLNGDGPMTGESSGCTTPLGAKNLVGNVWEWMSETVTNQELSGRQLPDSGYVSIVDNVGLVVETKDRPQEAYGKDFASVAKDGVTGILRGGFYGSGEDGGIFSQNLAAPLNLAAVGVGFRCVADVW